MMIKSKKNKNQDYRSMNKIENKLKFIKELRIKLKNQNIKGSI